MGLNVSRLFETWTLGTLTPTLKRWAIFIISCGTETDLHRMSCWFQVGDI
jgi:hypothetical protein